MVSQNFRSMNLHILRGYEFVYSFLCTVNVNNNVHIFETICRLVVTELVKLFDEFVTY